MLQLDDIFAATGNLRESTGFLRARRRRCCARRPPCAGDAAAATGAVTVETGTCNYRDKLLHSRSRRETKETTTATAAPAAGKGGDRRNTPGRASRSGASLVPDGAMGFFIREQQDRGGRVGDRAVHFCRSYGTGATGPNLGRRTGA